MEIRVHIPFEELVAIVKQLSPIEKTRLQKELAGQARPVSGNSRLTELLLSGPVFTDRQIRTMRETRKSINRWRTRPL